jgi:hypothetical protein
MSASFNMFTNSSFCHSTVRLFITHTFFKTVKYAEKQEWRIKMSDEAVVSYLKALSQHLTERSKENHENEIAGLTSNILTEDLPNTK